MATSEPNGDRKSEADLTFRFELTEAFSAAPDVPSHGELRTGPIMIILQAGRNDNDVAGFVRIRIVASSASEFLRIRLSHHASFWQHEE
jgi:hypothetical protein